MPQRTDPFRLLRAGAATVVILALAAGAHVAGGGSLPVPVLLAALGAFTLAGVSITSGRRFRPASLFLVLGAGQIGLHGAFMLLAPGGCPPDLASAHAGGHHGGVHPAATAAAAACLPDGADGTGPAAALFTGQHGAGPAFFLAHLAAVALTAWVLARGEDALHATVAWLRPLFRLPVPARLPATRAAAIAGPASAAVPTRYSTARPLRGPPSYALA